MNVKCLESEKTKLVQLKKIEIYGFKSFADKTELEFNQGVTAVVGPNGCGKSNIADAFRWVLGEQSAKSMRGNKMPDVIFAGTSLRKPLNFAEVTITLCNEGGQLPIEFAEVSVTRRLHRSGESDYFINRNPVRMKDIQSLFLDSGMGKNTFSIFEQGKIDQVINYTPLERRYIFEEAAGILRFLQRKREALRKLEESDLNTARVRDIHKEEEKQIAVLQNQAEKARLFKENKTRLESLEKAVYLVKWENLSNKVEEISSKETSKKKEVQDINLNLEAEYKAINLAKLDLELSEKILKTSLQAHFKAKSEKELKSLEKKTNQERLKEVTTKSALLNKELDGMVEKRILHQTDFKAAKAEQSLVALKLVKEEETLQKQRAELNGLEVNLNKLRDGQQKAQSEVLKLVQLENQLESELKQNTVRFDHASERQAENQLKKQKLQLQIQEFEIAKNGQKKELDDSVKVIDGQKQLLVDLEKKLTEAIHEISTKRTLLAQASKEISEMKARQKALLRLKEDMEGFSSGSKRLLQESKKKSSQLYQKMTALYECISPKMGSEGLLASSLRGYTETLVVKEKNHLEEVIAFAKKEKLKNFSLICLENLNDSAAKSAAKSLDVEPVLDFVSKTELATHFLKNMFIAKNNVSAWKFVKEVEGVQVLTKDGSFIDANQVTFYTEESESNLFLREAELVSLEKKLNESESFFQELEKTITVQETKKNQIQQERVELDRQVRKLEMTLVEINFGLQRLITDFNRAQKEMDTIDEELAVLVKSLQLLENGLVETKQKHIEAKAKRQNSQNSTQHFAEDLTQQTEKFKQVAATTKLLEASFHKIVDQNRKLIHAINVFEIKDMESATQEKRIMEEIKASSEMQTFISTKGENVESNLEMVEKAFNTTAALCAKFEGEVAIKKKEIVEFEKRISMLHSLLKKVENEIHQTDISFAEINSFLKSLETELMERYQLVIDDLKKQNLKGHDQTLQQMEKNIAELKAAIFLAGDINMTSIEQLTQHQARYGFLNEQLDDLNHSKQELIGIITELDKTSRKIFKETFELIRQNFKKNFNILFNGGEADLEFTESGDILEAGIEISAKPPGKQMRSISLLSGGEKCLTAMALLFAIFEVKPAPFCILDEIDAPLDDSNVERFVNVVKQFIDRCQFIIITHNKRTMAIADVLFGVSMEEKGVSKLLSIDFLKKE